MNYKIVFVMTFSPKYKEYENQPRPDFFWEKQDGSWVGIWGKDWGDFLGKIVVSYLPDVDFEIWQVDERADKIYSAELSERLVHKQFPARQKKYLRGLKIAVNPYSKVMLEHARQYDRENVIFFIPSTEIYPFRDKLIKATSLSRKVHYNALNTKVLIPSLQFSYNPVLLIHRLLLKRVCLRNLLQIRNLMTQEDNPLALKQIKEKNPEMNIFTFRIANFDLDFWKQDISKEAARKQLNIPDDLFVMVLSQRLVPVYQIDKFIEVISQVKSQKDFICYISGHGLGEYEDYLKELVNKHQLDKKIKFIGFVTEEELKNYLIAGDVFVTVPAMFAGSAGALKAMAIERPIIHVTLGLTYNFLKEQDAGLYLNPNDYKQWVKTFEEVVDGKKVKIVPRSVAVEYFSSERTARDVLQIIKNAL
jgi:glycosyltransferase involved in cell wall biosynthesis